MINEAELENKQFMGALVQMSQVELKELVNSISAFQINLVLPRFGGG